MEAVHVVQDGEILRVTLARPEVRNAWDEVTIRELSAAFADVGDARAVVLAGDGPSFSAGASADWMRRAGRLSFEENLADAQALQRMLEGIDSCPAPVLVAVHGHAFGGGAGLVACADIAVAAPGTLFAFSEVKLGIVPATISPFVIRAIGERAARHLFTTGRIFDTETARRIGLVHEVSDDLGDAVERLVDELLTAAPLATRAAKRLVRERLEGDATARLIAQIRQEPEAQEGLEAFLAGRRPGRPGFASWCPTEATPRTKPRRSGRETA